MTRAGTALWFAGHEWRLAWRDWVSMMTAGKRERARRVAIGFVAFVAFMHVVANFVVGDFAAAPLDKATLLRITAVLLLSWLLMISQAIESMTRAFYARADLDLILASPVAAERLFAVRMSTVALMVAAMALPLAAPFVDVLVLRGGVRWLGAYGVIAAMGASATAIAIAITVALFRALGPKRTRLVAQVVAAVIGAAFVIGLQVAAILSHGTLSRGSVLASKTALALAPDPDSVLYVPARAVLGDAPALAEVLLLGLLLLAAAVAAMAPRFGGYAIAAVGAADHAGSRGAGRARSFRAGAPRQVLRRKEWQLLRRDPWLVSQTLMQMLYLLPPALMLWRSFQSGGGAQNLLVPVLVMAAGQLAGGLAWLTISGEDAPDLVASAPVSARALLAAKIEAVLGVIALVFAPLVVLLAAVSLWHALVAGAGIVVAAMSATAIQLWFRTQAKRSQFRRRQVSSRVATFAEAFASIGWAATSAVAAFSLPLALAPCLITLGVVGGARALSPRQGA
jgi:ABC-2 type transport system permease protein